MQRLLFAAVMSSAMLLGSGCQESRTPTLHGQFRSSGSAAITNPIHLAMGWYPTWLWLSRGEATNTFVAQEATYRGTFPADFTYELHGAPPESAMVDLAPLGGKGKAAYGFLVAFEDGNGNGTFDAATSAAPSPDRIVGISEAESSLPPPPHRYLVVYLDGEWAQSGPLGGFHLEQGYTLFELRGAGGIDIVPLDTSIGVEVTRTNALQVFGCESSDFSASYETSCGIDPYDGKYRIWSVMYADQGPLQMRISDASGYRADATLRLNGAAATYDGADYTWDSLSGGANTFQIDVPGYPTETIDVNVPRPITLTTQAPSNPRSGSRLTVGWSEDPAVELYSFSVASDNDGLLFHTSLSATSITTDPIVATGTARVAIAALGPVAIGSNGGFVTPRRWFSANFNFTP